MFYASSFQWWPFPFNLLRNRRFSFVGLQKRYLFTKSWPFLLLLLVFLKYQRRKNQRNKFRTIFFLFICMHTKQQRDGKIEKWFSIPVCLRLHLLFNFYKKHERRKRGKLMKKMYEWNIYRLVGRKKITQHIQHFAWTNNNAVFRSCPEFQHQKDA